MNSISMKIFFTILLLVCSGSGSVQAEDLPLLRFAVTDIAGLEELQREFTQFEEVLTRHAQVRLKFYPVSDRNIVIEAFKRKNIDIALAGPAEYVVINKRVGGTPVVALERENYYSAIITRKDSGITSLDQLRGQKVGFGDVGSTSYHLAPMQIFKDAGIDPVNDIKPLHINKHVAWTSLVRGDLPAIGFNYERFELFSSKDKKVTLDDFRILGQGRQLPGDVLIAGKDVSPELIARLKKAFSEHGNELLQAMLQGERNQKYTGMHFEANVDDADYDYIRSMFATVGFPQYSEFLGDA